MIIYIAAIDDAMEGEVAYPTLRQAKADRDPGTKITKVTLGRMTRHALCCLFNREGYAVTQEEIV